MVLLAQIRKLLNEKGWNSAQLASVLNLDRRRMRNILAGKESLTVDTFFDIVEKLQITPSDLGFAVDSSKLDLSTVEEEDLKNLPDVLFDESQQVVELFKLGFRLGIDMHFVADSSLLNKSGIPITVLSRFPQTIPIKLDAAFHKFNKPEFHEDSLQINLSFDGISTCYFPWKSVLQISFKPEHFDAPEKPVKPEKPLEPEPPKKIPSLRLIKS